MNRGEVSTLDGGGGTFLGRGQGYLTWMGEGYLPWMGVPILDGREGVPTLDQGGYLLWTGYVMGGTPLAASHRRTFLLTNAFSQTFLIRIQE